LFATADLWEIGSNKAKTEYNQNELDFLYEHREKIRWGNGRGGIFTHLAFFYPLSEKELSSEEYLELLEKLKLQIENEEPSIIERLYFQKTDKKEEFRASKATLIQFIDIFKNNLPVYESCYWKQYKPSLEEVKIEMDIELNKYDIITKWEKFLAIEFSADIFQIVLTHANKKMPSANNLSKFRYNFFMYDDLLTFLQHEVGTNLLSDSKNSLYGEEVLNNEFVKKNNVIWLAFESLAEFYRGIIFSERDAWKGEMFGGGTYHFEWFFEFYKKNINFGENPSQIMKKAVLAFQAAFEKNS
jgi:hypothetical protein